MQLTMFAPADEAPKQMAGRPVWNKYKEYQRLVDYMLRRGCSLPEIAAEVGVSIPTLRHYFWRTPTWQDRWGHLARTRGRGDRDA